MLILWILRILGVALLAYTFVISLRIILSWVHSEGLMPLYDTLCRITDPYLSLFRNLRFLRLGGMDFSPIFAIGILIILSNILLMVTTYGGITLSLILFVTFSTLSQAILALGGLLAIILVIRYVSLVFFKTPQTTFWDKVDSLLFVPLSVILHFFRRKPGYPQLLLTAILSLLLLIILTTLLFSLIGFLLRLIPF